METVKNVAQGVAFCGLIVLFVGGVPYAKYMKEKRWAEEYAAEKAEEDRQQAEQQRIYNEAKAAYEREVNGNPTNLAEYIEFVAKGTVPERCYARL